LVLNVETELRSPPFGPPAPNHKYLHKSEMTVWAGIICWLGVKSDPLWSAVACYRFEPGQLAARSTSRNERTGPDPQEPPLGPMLVLTSAASCLTESGSTNGASGAAYEPALPHSKGGRSYRYRSCV